MIENTEQIIEMLKRRPEVLDLIKAYTDAAKDMKPDQRRALLELTLDYLHGDSAGERKAEL